MNILAAVTVAVIAMPVVAEEPYYRLTPVSSGNTYSLDVGDVSGLTNHIAMLLPTGSALGQYWQLERSLNGDVRLKNSWSGLAQCLDSDNRGYLFMDTCGLQIGQRWQIHEMVGQGVRLTNTYKPGECLTFGSHDPAAPVAAGLAVLNPCTSISTQIWTISHTGIY